MPAHFPCEPRLAVAVADDSPAMREGLARIIADECDLATCGSAASGAELRTLVARGVAKVLITELLMNDGDGLALLKEIAAAAPALGIVIFTGHPQDVYAPRCLRAGARAFVSKRAPVATLLRVVREVATGGTVWPSGVSMFAAAGAVPANASAGLAASLTNRELQVFHLVGAALPTREIASRLGVSVKTVETHRENIKNKLGLGSHAELVARAAQWRREPGGA